MQVLKKNGFNVPEPVAQSRHTVVMELVDAFPLRQIQSVPDPAGLYAELIDVILRLASFGLIHGDFNEFNILIKENEAPKERKTTKKEANDDDVPKEHGTEESKPEGDEQSKEPETKSSEVKLTTVIIDFPQMVSIDHTNAEMYFDRDVNCIKRFFERRFNFISDESGPRFADARKLAAGNQGKRLDVEVEASGFSKKMAKELEKYMQAVGVDGDGGYDEDGGGREHSDEDDPDDSPYESHDELSKDMKMPSSPDLGTASMPPGVGITDLSISTN